MTRSAPPGPPDVVNLALAELVHEHHITDVVDVGGGSGTYAVPLARLGCRVLVVDTSIDALASLRRRAVEAGVDHLITSLQGDAEASGDLLPDGQTAELVMAHHVLEHVEQLDAVAARMAAALGVGGFVSVVVPGRLGAVLHQGAAGRSAAAGTMLTSPDGTSGRTDVVRRRFDATGLEGLFASIGWSVYSLRGVRVLDNLLSMSARPGADHADPAGSGRLETLLSEHPVLRQIGTDLHCIGRSLSSEATRGTAIGSDRAEVTRSM